MKISPEKMQKVKKILKKCNFWRIVLVFGVILAYLATCYFSDSFIEILLSVVFICYVIHVCSLKIFNKFIGSVLTKEFDPDTYLALICQGKVDSPAAIRQIPGEYFCGNYQNVISICNTKLADPKIAKRYRYYYLLYLANTYFDIGDDETLRLTCDRYREVLSAEKPNKQAKIRKNYTRMDFFETYLNRDIDTCIKMISDPVPMEIDQHRRTFYRAKFAILQGKEDMAREYCEALVKAVPDLTYGKLADKALERMDAQEETCNVFDFSGLAEAEVNIGGITHRPFLKKLAIILIVFSGVIILGSGIFYGYNSYKYEKYMENVYLLLEEDYDGVEVFELFILEDGKDDVDSMFICKTDTEIIVGCFYHRSDSAAMHYKKQAEVSIESISADNFIKNCTFSAVTTDNQIHSCFYTNLADVPDNSYYLIDITVGDCVVYYAVTNIVPND